VFKEKKKNLTRGTETRPDAWKLGEAQSPGPLKEVKQIVFDGHRRGGRRKGGKKSTPRVVKGKDTKRAGKADKGTRQDGERNGWVHRWEKERR